MSEEGIGVRDYYECPVCFKCWSEESDSNVISPGDKPKLCDYCQKMKLTYYGDAMITERRLEVMGSAKLTRLPEILKLMWKVCQERYDES